jgi:hypothetical protein
MMAQAAEARRAGTRVAARSGHKCHVKRLALEAPRPELDGGSSGHRPVNQSCTMYRTDARGRTTASALCSARIAFRYSNRQRAMPARIDRQTRELSPGPGKRDYAATPALAKGRPTMDTGSTFRRPWWGCVSKRVFSA